VCLASIAERHYEDSHKNHGRNSANPVEMRLQDAILSSVRAHTEDLERSQVCADKSQSGHPAWEGATGEEDWEDMRL